MGTQNAAPAESNEGLVGRLSGWWFFSALMILMAGVFNVIEGLVALGKKEYFFEGGLVYENLQFWGWAALIVGAVQVVTAVLVFYRSEVGLVMGFMVAVISATVAFFAIGAYPWWAVSILVVNGLVMYGLTRTSTDYSESSSGY